MTFLLQDFRQRLDGNRGGSAAGVTALLMQRRQMPAPSHNMNSIAEIIAFPDRAARAVSRASIAAIVATWLLTVLTQTTLAATKGQSEFTADGSTVTFSGPIELKIGYEGDIFIRCIDLDNESPNLKTVGSLIPGASSMSVNTIIAGGRTKIGGQYVYVSNNRLMGSDYMMALLTAAVASQKKVTLTIVPQSTTFTNDFTGLWFLQYVSVAQ